MNHSKEQQNTLAALEETEVRQAETTQPEPRKRIVKAARKEAADEIPGQGKMVRTL
jgi:hypothetical protein